MSELERRKELGFKYGQILSRQQTILTADESSREHHQVAFMSGVRESMRILREYTENRQDDQVSEFDDQLIHRVASRVESIIQRLSLEITSECHRRGAWALVNKATGARICDKNREVYRREDILDAEGNVTRPELLREDPNTGLLVPEPDQLYMLLSDGSSALPIPGGFFVHPSTLNTYPIEGKHTKCD